MIRHIRGTVLEQDPTSIIVDVRGIGYLIHSVEPSLSVARGETITLHTHLAVRENALDLYGFSRRDLLEAFEMLITLPKIGPKSAQQILSQVDVATLRRAVAEQDPSYLAKISGVGKKSAEKIVFGLKDVLDIDEDTDVGVDDMRDSDTSGVIHDTIEALVTLGYPYEEAKRVVRDLYREAGDIDTPELLRITLAKLSAR